jgi:CubicO group peptidase (beta-lactamase class C family)
VRQGLDPARLIAADRHFQALPTLASVLVMRRGRLVFERYYHGATADQERNVFSVTKSVVSALVGIALRDGDLRSLDQRLVDFFPEKLERSTDEGVRTITLRDLLTMTAGYRSEQVLATDDWVRTLINRPLASVPGVTWAYDDGSAHLVSAVLTKATGTSVESFARRKLLGPLGIRPGPWTSDGQGHSLGSTGLHLRPRDLLALGRLYLQNGKWQGRQIVPASWIRISTATQVSIPGGYAYGYLWWVNTGPHKGFLAQGAWGQIVAVYPRSDVVIAITGAGDFDRVDVLRVLLHAVVP